MKIAFITGGIPNPHTGGGACIAYGMVESLRRGGREVSVLSLVGEHSVAVAIEARVFQVKVERQRTLNPVKWVLPSANSRPRVKEWLEFVKPDCIVCYHWDALAAVPRTKIPVICGVSDPLGAGCKVRGEWFGWLLRTVIQRWLMWKCTRIGAFSGHHSKEMGLEYWRAPICP